MQFEGLSGSYTYAARYVHGPGIDEPLMMQRNINQYFYVYDGLGTIADVVNSNGIVVNHYDYDSFGNFLYKDENVKNPYTYTGREYDEETALYYYRARYYDAQSGRFVSKDSSLTPNGKLLPPLLNYQLRDFQDINPFIYVTNDPINSTDPFGLIKWHFDPIKNGTEKFIHYTDGKDRFRFNRLGELVEHTGKVIGKAKGKALKALKYLKNVKPSFFKLPLLPVIIIDPCLTDPRFICGCPQKI